MSGNGISWAVCKSAPRSRQITTPAPHHAVFYKPDALPAAQPTASKHWRHNTTVIWPLYRTTCIGWHPELRTGGFCCSKVLLPACPCWQQLAHSYYAVDTNCCLYCICIGRHCFSSVTCITGVPQGSVLGPLLFTAYISPIAHIHNIDQQQYDDDTRLAIMLEFSSTVLLMLSLYFSVLSPYLASVCSLNSLILITTQKINF